MDGCRATGCGKTISGSGRLAIGTRVLCGRCRRSLSNRSRSHQVLRITGCLVTGPGAVANGNGAMAAGLFDVARRFIFSFAMRATARDEIFEIQIFGESESLCITREKSWIRLN